MSIVQNILKKKKNIYIKIILDFFNISKNVINEDVLKLKNKLFTYNLFEILIILLFILPIVWFFLFFNFFFSLIFIFLNFLNFLIYYYLSSFNQDKEYIIKYKKLFVKNNFKFYTIEIIIMYLNYFKKKAFNNFYTIIKLITKYKYNTNKNTLNYKIKIFFIVIFRFCIKFFFLIITSYSLISINTSLKLFDILKSNSKLLKKKPINEKIILIFKDTLTDFYIDLEFSLPENLLTKKIIINNKIFDLNPIDWRNACDIINIEKTYEALTLIMKNIEKNSKYRMVYLKWEMKPHFSNLLPINEYQNALIRETKSVNVKSYLKDNLNNSLTEIKMPTHTPSQGTLNSNISVSRTSPIITDTDNCEYKNDFELLKNIQSDDFKSIQRNSIIRSMFYPVFLWENNKLVKDQCYLNFKDKLLNMTQNELNTDSGKTLKELAFFLNDKTKILENYYHEQIVIEMLISLQNKNLSKNFSMTDIFLESLKNNNFD